MYMKLYFAFIKQKKKKNSTDRFENFLAIFVL